MDSTTFGSWLGNDLRLGPLNDILGLPRLRPCSLLYPKEIACCLLFQ